MESKAVPTVELNPIGLSLADYAAVRPRFGLAPPGMVAAPSRPRFEWAFCRKRSSR